MPIFGKKSVECWAKYLNIYTNLYIFAMDIPKTLPILGILECEEWINLWFIFINFDRRYLSLIDFDWNRDY